jgi:hypothetical protein
MLDNPMLAGGLPPQLDEALARYVNLTEQRSALGAGMAERVRMREQAAALRGTPSLRGGLRALLERGR